MTNNKSVWESEEVAKAYLENERGAVPGNDIQLAIILKTIQHWHDKPKTIMDLGCGNGIIGKYLLASCPGSKGVFIDISDAMLESAGENLEQFPGSEIIKGDLSSVGWLEVIDKNKPVDIVVSGFAIHHLTDQRKRDLYTEIYEILSPGGIFLNLDHVDSASPEVEHLFEQYYIDHLHKFQMNYDPGVKREEVEKIYLERPDKDEDKPVMVDIQCDWLRDIGFKDVDCFFKLFVVALFGGRKT